MPPTIRKRLPYIDPCEVCGGSHLTWLHDTWKQSVHHAHVITSERHARSEWGNRAEWCDECNGWVRRG